MFKVDFFGSESCPSVLVHSHSLRGIRPAHRETHVRSETHRLDTISLCQRSGNSMKMFPQYGWVLAILNWGNGEISAELRLRICIRRYCGQLGPPLDPTSGWAGCVYQVSNHGHFRYQPFLRAMRWPWSRAIARSGMGKQTQQLQRNWFI